MALTLEVFFPGILWRFSITQLKAPLNGLRDWVYEWQENCLMSEK